MGYNKRQVSVRICAKQYNRFEIEAEQKGLYITDIVKEKLDLAERQIETRDMLRNLLNLITKHSFEITSTVAGLDPDEKEAARLSIEKQIGRRIK